ncbi:hypothetical protein LX32DRAFT_251978 [Colletotrichum zoysiae]|uniref:Uncharacterized protein n=1 Tax=Colletotrichum zoysiae TaxID=1216348 RepID=A0AAD9LX14_9PEZI|nr:hypothetical protein LX32DRAFT_251978 [Colletotrichum zoysiae]
MTKQHKSFLVTAFPAHSSQYRLYTTYLPTYLPTYPGATSTKRAPLSAFQWSVILLVVHACLFHHASICVYLLCLHTCLPVCLPVLSPRLHTHLSRLHLLPCRVVSCPIPIRTSSSLIWSLLVHQSLPLPPPRPPLPCSVLSLGGKEGKEKRIRSLTKCTLYSSREEPIHTYQCFPFSPALPFSFPPLSLLVFISPSNVPSCRWEERRTLRLDQPRLSNSYSPACLGLFASTLL